MDEVSGAPYNKLQLERRGRDRHLRGAKAQLLLDAVAMRGVLSTAIAAVAVVAVAVAENMAQIHWCRKGNKQGHAAGSTPLPGHCSTYPARLMAPPAGFPRRCVRTIADGLEQH